MSTQPDPTGNSELDGAHMTPAGEAPAAGASDTMSLADINSLLGKDFKDIETAKRSLKETQSYVGKKKEDIAAELASSLPPTPAAPDASSSQLRSIETRLFYSEHPQYKGHEALIASMGADPATVVETEAFKTTFEKLKVADEIAQTRSVVSSSPRLAQTKSATDQAVAVANAAGSSVDQVADVLAKAINEELAANQ